MKLIALCGAAGAGKDTVADMLPARKLAFADALYREVAQAWGVEQHVLRCRETKEKRQPELRIGYCADRAFHQFALRDDPTDPPRCGRGEVPARFSSGGATTAALKTRIIS